MTKDEIKATIANLKLPEELEKIIVDMVDSAEEVNGPLLNAIADILDNQADHDNSMADAYDEIQQVDEASTKELQALDAEHDLSLLQAESQIQDDLIKELEDNPEGAPAAEDPVNVPQETPMADSVPDMDAQATVGEIPSEPQPSYSPSTPDIASPIVETPASAADAGIDPVDASAPSPAPVPVVDEQARQDSIAELKDQIAQMDQDQPPNSTVA